jgi:hypothetical protein
MGVKRDKLEHFVGRLAANKDRAMREAIAAWEDGRHQRHVWRRSPTAKRKILSSFELAKGLWIVNCRWKESGDNDKRDLPHSLFKANWNKAGVPKKPFKGTTRRWRTPWRDGEEINLDVFRKHPEWILQKEPSFEVANNYAARYAGWLYWNRFGRAPDDNDIDSLSGKREDKLHPAKITALLNALVELGLIKQISGHSPKRGRGAVYEPLGELKPREWTVTKKRRPALALAPQNRSFPANRIRFVPGKVDG